MSSPRLHFPTARMLGFLGRFILVYGLLIIPWPGLNTAYSHYFQAMGRSFFSQEGAKRIVDFAPYQDPSHRLDTRITVSNRDLLNSQAKGSTIYLDMDTRGIGWIPTALTVALILTTAIPWKRRAWALLWGLAWVHVFILFSVWIHIWFNSEDASLVTFSSFWEPVVEGLDYTLVTQIGASFSVPVLIWILVTFRRKDLISAETAS